VKSDPQPDTQISAPLLGRTQQAGLALFVLVAAVSTAAWWIYHGGPGGRLVEVEKAHPQTAVFQVDINTADWPELVELPGVGEIIAAAIIESREKLGPFRSHDELLRVRGIGLKTLEKLRPHLLPIARAAGGCDKGNDKAVR
jgi:competence protein ComEA